MFSVKTYQVVSVVPLSLDLKVESEFIGVKSSKGKEGKGALRKVADLSGGEISKSESGRRGATIRTFQKGELSKPSVESSQFGSSPFTRAKSRVKGEGRGRVKLSAELLRGKTGSPKVKYSPLAPYLIEVRREIMRNWKLPYYTQDKGLKRAVVVLTIRRDGEIEELSIRELSSDVAFNRSAVSAIYSVGRFKPFPEKVKEEKIRLKVKFEYK